MCSDARSNRWAQRVYSLVRARECANSVVGNGYDNDTNCPGLVPAAEINSLEIGRRTKEPGRCRRSHISFTTRCTIGIKSFQSSPFGFCTPNLTSPTRIDGQRLCRSIERISLRHDRTHRLDIVQRCVILVVPLGGYRSTGDIITTAFKATVNVDCVHLDSKTLTSSPLPPLVSITIPDRWSKLYK